MDIYGSWFPKEDALKFAERFNFSFVPKELYELKISVNNGYRIDAPNVSVNEITQVWTDATYLHRSYRVTISNIEPLYEKTRGFANTTITKYNLNYKRGNFFTRVLLQDIRLAYDVYSGNYNYSNVSVHLGWKSLKQGSMLEPWRGQ